MSQNIDPVMGKMCGETTKHAQLGNTGSCMCGHEKYAVQKEIDVNNLPGCAWCRVPPAIDNIQTQEVFCPTEGCPAFNNVVTKEKWVDRGNHEKEVMWIPTEEPIFIMRGQDMLAQAPVWSWIDLAEKKKVPEFKIDSAVNRANEMTKYEREVKSKLPD